MRIRASPRERQLRPAGLLARCGLRKKYVKRHRFGIPETVRALGAQRGSGVTGAATTRALPYIEYEVAIDGGDPHTEGDRDCPGRPHEDSVGRRRVVGGPQRLEGAS